MEEVSEQRLGRPLEYQVAVEAGSSYQNGIITIDLADLNNYYKARMPDAFEDQFSNLIGDEWEDAVKDYERKNMFNRFSKERAVFHEVDHACCNSRIVPNEQRTIERTNDFMDRAYNEPARKNHFAYTADEVRDILDELHSQWGRSK